MELRKYQWQHIRRLTRWLISSKMVGYIAGTGVGKTTVFQVVVGRLIQNNRFRIVIALVPQGHLKSKLKEYTWNSALKHPAEYPYYIPKFVTPVWKEWKEISNFQDEGCFVACYNAFTHVNKLQEIFEWIKTLDDGALADLLIVLDEGHHRGGEKGNALAKLVTALKSKGATCLLMTATNFRTDGLEVIDMSKYPCVFRSLSEQAQDGLAPSQWLFGIQVMEGVPHANMTRAQMKVAARQVFNQWNDEGQPVTIIEVPCAGGASLEWQKLITDIFREEATLAITEVGDPILQAVGVGSKTQRMVKDALEAEDLRIHGEDGEDGLPFDEWLIRVVVTARRFKEGTDLPSASHYFRIGNPPTSLQDVLQSMGRCTRGKFDFKGYPEKFKDIVKVIFFVPGTPPPDGGIRKALIKNQLFITAYLSSMHISMRGIRYTLQRHIKASGGTSMSPDRLAQLERTLPSITAIYPHHQSQLMVRVAQEAEIAKRKGHTLSLAKLKQVLRDEAQILNIDSGVIDALIFAMIPAKAQQQVIGKMLDLDDVLGVALDQYILDNQATLDEKFVFSVEGDSLIEFTAKMTRQDADAIAEVLVEASATDMLTDAEILSIITFHRDQTGHKVKVNDNPILVPEDLKDRVSKVVTGRMLNRTLLNRDIFYIMDITALRQMKLFLGAGALTRGQILRALAEHRGPLPNPLIFFAWLQNDPRFQTQEKYRNMVSATSLGKPYTWLSVQVGLRRGWFGYEPGLDLQTLGDNPLWGGFGEPSLDEVEAHIGAFEAKHHRLPGKQDIFDDTDDKGSIVWQDYLRIRHRRGSTTATSG